MVIMDKCNEKLQVPNASQRFTKICVAIGRAKYESSKSHFSLTPQKVIYSKKTNSRCKHDDYFK